MITKFSLLALVSVSFLTSVAFASDKPAVVPDRIIVHNIHVGLSDGRNEDLLKVSNIDTIITELEKRGVLTPEAARIAKKMNKDGELVRLPTGLIVLSSDAKKD